MDALALDLILLGIALAYVVVPAVLEGFADYEASRKVTCPATANQADIRASRLGGVAEIFGGRPDPRVVGCSLWPERKGCDRACVRPASA